MVTVVHNTTGQTLVKLNRKKVQDVSMDFAAKRKQLEEDLKSLDRLEKEAEKITSAAQKWHEAGVTIDVIIAGLKEAGYSLPTSNGRAKRGSGGAMGIDAATAHSLVAHVKKEKKPGLTVNEIRNALNLAKDANIGPALRAAIEAGDIKSAGEKRGTRYFGA